MTLRDQIVGRCSFCRGFGYIGNQICSCLLKFRACNRVADRGFKEGLLDIVSSTDYRLPIVENGVEFLNYYINNLAEVEEKGLGLYIFSRERGRGKTTLAHYLMYKVAERFSSTERYRRESSLSFGFDRSKDMVRKGDVVSNDLCTSTFYVLDDLGGEERTPQWKRENVISVLQEVLHYRRDKRLSTIITSNYHPADLSVFYDGVVNSLLEIKDDGNIGGSLLRQVEVGGPIDLRVAEDNSEWPDGM